MHKCPRLDTCYVRGMQLAWEKKKNAGRSIVSQSLFTRYLPWRPAGGGTKDGYTGVEIQQPTHSSHADAPFLLGAGHHRIGGRAGQDTRSLCWRTPVGPEAQGLGTQRAQGQAAAHTATKSSAPTSAADVGETDGADGKAEAEAGEGADGYGVYCHCVRCCCSHCCSTRAGVRSAKYTGFPARRDVGAACQACAAVVDSGLHRLG